MSFFFVDFPSVLVYNKDVEDFRGIHMYEKWLRENGIEDRIFSIQELDQLNEDLLWGMVTVTPRRGGIPYKLWLDPMGITRGTELRK